MRREVKAIRPPKDMRNSRTRFEAPPPPPVAAGDATRLMQAWVRRRFGALRDAANRASDHYGWGRDRSGRPVKAEKVLRGDYAVMPADDVLRLARADGPAFVLAFLGAACGDAPCADDTAGDVLHHLGRAHFHLSKVNEMTVRGAPAGIAAGDQTGAGAGCQRAAARATTRGNVPAPVFHRAGAAE